MATAYSTPVLQKDRIQIIDTIRGIALLGILLMNIPFFSNPEAYYFNLTTRNEYSGINYYTWWVIEGLFAGTMRGLFSMLFGAGSLLLLSRLEKRSMDETPADIYYRRLLWLLLFGLFNAFILQWFGDILYAYAICGLFLFPFRKLKARHLLYLAILFMFFGVLQGTYRWHVANKIRVEGEQALALEKKHIKLTSDQEDARKAWIGYQEKHKIENVRKEAEKDISKVRQAGYFRLMNYYLPNNAEMESSMLYGGTFFDVMPMFFLGMALFKSGVITGKRSKKFYWILTACCLPVGMAINYMNLKTFIAINFDPSLLLPRLKMNLYQPHRMLQSVAYMSLIILVYKYGLLQSLWRWLSRVGQMAFTNYLMQSIICSIIFFGYGFGLFGKLQRYQEYYVVVAIWIFQIIFSNVWMRYYRFGPFEWLWRSLTYWHQQPMKRHRAIEEKEPEEPVAAALA